MLGIFLQLRALPNTRGVVHEADRSLATLIWDRKRQGLYADLLN